MSPKVAEAEAVESAAPATPPKKESSRLVLIVAIVALLITAQAVITWLLMPKSADAKGQAAAGKEAGAENRSDDHGDDANVDAAEVSMGDFNCTNSTAAPGVVVQIDFKLSAVTTSGQKAQLDQQLKDHHARVRQVVNKIVRSSSLEDLNDPNLGTLKRLIREEVNRMLRKSLIAEVVISDIRTMEQ